MKFFFGEPCPHCRAGWAVTRWQRYDGTGSWRMHESGSVTLDTYDSIYCERNGWFSRHRFLTTLIVIGVPVYTVIGAIAIWS